MVNNKEVLTDIDFIVSEAGDEVLMKRPENKVKLGCEIKDDQAEEISKDFRNDDLRSMNLKYGKNEAVFCGGEDIGNLNIQFSIYLFHQSNRLLFLNGELIFSRKSYFAFYIS